jgi:hypothetical protein
VVVVEEEKEEEELTGESSVRVMAACPRPSWGKTHRISLSMLKSMMQS